MPYRFLKIEKEEGVDFSPYLKDPTELKEEPPLGIFRSPEGFAAAIIYDDKGVILVADERLLNDRGLQAFQPFEGQIEWNVIRPPRKRGLDKWTLVFAANRRDKDDFGGSNIKAGGVVICFDELDFLFKKQIPVRIHDTGRFRKGDTISLLDGRSLVVMGVS